MIPTTYTVVAQRAQTFFGVDLEGRGAFGPNEERLAEAFAQQLLSKSREQPDESKKLDRVFVMKTHVFRVFGSPPVHPENRAGGS